MDGRGGIPVCQTCRSLALQKSRNARHFSVLIGSPPIVSNGKPASLPTLLQVPFRRPALIGDGWRRTRSFSQPTQLVSSPVFKIYVALSLLSFPSYPTPERNMLLFLPCLIHLIRPPPGTLLRLEPPTTTITVPDGSYHLSPPSLAAKP